MPKTDILRKVPFTFVPLGLANGFLIQPVGTVPSNWTPETCSCTSLGGRVTFCGWLRLLRGCQEKAARNYLDGRVPWRHVEAGDVFRGNSHVQRAHLAAPQGGQWQRGQLLLGGGGWAFFDLRKDLAFWRSERPCVLLSQGNPFDSGWRFTGQVLNKTLQGSDQCHSHS